MREAILAPLGAFGEKGRVWKRFDFAVMDVSHEQGLISDYRRRKESVRLTSDGRRMTGY